VQTRKFLESFGRNVDAAGGLAAAGTAMVLYFNIRKCFFFAKKNTNLDAAFYTKVCNLVVAAIDYEVDVLI